MAARKLQNQKSRKIVARSGKTISRTATRSSRQKAEPEQGRVSSSRYPTTATIIKKLRRPEGASLAELAEISGWKPNSVRGFLHGPILKKRGLALRSSKDSSGERRYFVSGGE